MGRLLRILLLTIAAIVGVGVLASVALFLFFDPNDFRDEISAEVKEVTGRDLRIEGDLSLSVFPWLAVNIGRTELGNAPGFGDEPFLSFEEAKLSVKLIPLLFKQTVTIGTASLDSFSLNLAVAANGKNNWADLAAAGRQAPAEETAEESQTRALDIASIQLREASISFRDAQAGTSNSVSGLTLSTGSIAAAKPFDVDAEFDFAAQPAGVSGHVGFATTMTLGDDNERLSLRGFSIDGQIDGIAAETTAYRFKAPKIDIDLAGDRMSMGEMEMSIFGLDLSADVEPYSLSNPRPKMSVAVQPFSLKNLMQVLGVEAPPTADPDALGRVSFSAKAAVGETAILLTSTTLELDDTKLMGQLSIPLSERGAYQFDLAADSINVDRYMAPAETAANKAAAPEDEIEIPVDLIRTLNANGTVKLERAYLSGMTFENLVVGVNSAKGQLRMHPLTAELFEGKYNGDIQINAASDTPSISVNEKVSGVQLAPLALAMFDQKNITGTISGGFKLSGRGKNLAAIRRNLGGSMAFSLADGAWQGTDLWYELRRARALFKKEPAPEPRVPARTEFTSVQLTGPVTDGVFHNDDLLAELPFLRLTGNGTVNLAEGQINYAMQARVLEKPEFAGAANEAELSDFTEAVIPLKITGALASPSIKPDIEAMLKAEVKRAVEKKGDELKKRLIDELIGGKKQPSGDQGTDGEAAQSGEEAQPQEEEAEDPLKGALKKLLDR
jgi:AsmA protein